MKAFRLLYIFAALLFTGCSSSGTDIEPDIEQWAHSTGKVRVLSTTAMIDDLVKEIGGDRVVHIPLIVGEIDPHTYELIKGDDEKLQMAQVIFYNGLGLEHGASLRHALSHHPLAINLGNSVQQHNPERILYAEQNLDPHIWMDISLWSEVIDPITQTLSQLDSDGAASYHKNAVALKEKMRLEHLAIQEAFSFIPESKRYLVTSHDAFQYFTRAYLALPEESKTEWSQRCDAPEGLAPEGQLSAADIQKIVDHLLRYRIRVVFPESNISPDSLKKIIHACRQKGLEVVISSQVLYGDAMGGKGSGAEKYLDMIRHNADVILKEWQSLEKGEK